MNRLVIWGLLLVACVVVATYRSRVYWTPSPQPASHIVFVTGGSGPYWQIAAAGAKAAAKKLDVKLTVQLPESEESVEQQTQILGQLGFADVDGLAISPLDAEGQTPLINRLNEKLPVILFDSDAPLSNRRCYVGTSNYAAGELCATLVREALPDGGKIAVLQANLTKHNNIERKMGFEETINAGPSGSTDQPERYSVVGFFVDEGETAKCAENIREALRQHPDLACIIGMNGHHGPILQDELNKEGKLDQVKLVVFDDFPETLEGIAAGHIYATVAQDPYQYGFEAVRLLKDVIADPNLHPVLGRGTVNFLAEPIRQSNLDEFRQRLDRQRKTLEPKAKTTTG
jgi:ribose transport system substrate-binding protein